MYNKRIVLFFLISFAAFDAFSQSCDLTMRGHVFDEASDMPLSYVNVFIQETAIGTVTDEQGNFIFDNMCSGEYHFTFSHIGCDGRKIHLDITKDTTIRIGILHTPVSLGTVVIEGQSNELVNQANLSVTRQSIEDNTNQNLASLLENETGVHLIKSGSGISKPVVHGLSGNRLTILNNSIAQSGQQWGNDHSPEIDPFSADKVIVVKGASAIQYVGGNLGSVILVEPKRIEDEPHLHGQVNYAFESNGLGNVLNTRLEQYTPAVAWRVNGTLKKSGDKRTSDYYLNNTGVEEANFSIQLEKTLSDKLFLDFYASTFNTQLGILRGSHIGNPTDLETALTNELPFFTEPDFSYKIDAPKQRVSHNLVKTKARYYINDNQRLELVLAGQANNRKEFDVRRSGRTDIPSLSLLQYTVNLEGKYSNDFSDDWNWTVGNQYVVTDNTNNPETGILPLIPDYLSWKSGLYTTLSRIKNRSQFNLGLRYDYEFQNVVTISNTVPKEIIRYDNNFNNLSGLIGIKFKIQKTQSISLNAGYAMRNPSINELYSSGLHQGVSGIEEGDINLNTEKAIKNTLEYKWFPNTKFSFSALAYHQHFTDYIFLNPQEEIRLTIRGAFPVFKYEQTDARIYGLDLSTQYTIGNSIFGVLKYSYLKGEEIADVDGNIPLVYMPPNSFYGSLTYRVKKPSKFSKTLIVEETEVELNNRFVFEQTNILPNQDFVKPPPSYNLIGLKVSTNIIFSSYKMRFFAKADNILNVRYRDYLNRQRYFADDNGRNVTVGLNLKF